MNGVLATFEREALIERHAHPAHGRILQVQLTAEGRRRIEAATPAIRALEQSLEVDFTADVKRWLGRPPCVPDVRPPAYLIHAPRPWAKLLSLGDG